jgi:uncharacterized membrane protein
MAGIGFELRKILRDDTYYSLLKAYGYAGIIGSGPWVLSILAVLLIGFLGLGLLVPHSAIGQFQVSVTHLILGSLILTGFLQVAFTRYVADRLFEGRVRMLLPSLHGALLITSVAAGAVGLLFIVFAGNELSVWYRLLMSASFAVLCQIWIVTVFLSGMKCYRAIVLLFALGYAVCIGAALALHEFGVEGLLGGFLIGQFVLLAGMMLFCVHAFPAKRFLSFEFLRKGRMYLSLVAAGFFYNFAVWIDKLIFWYGGDVGQDAVGPLNASIIYDTPIFLAYLSIIPGMAVFLVRLETDFVEFHAKFYDGIRQGRSLQHIEDMRDNLIASAWDGIYAIMKVQAVTILAIIIAGPALLRWLGISELYLTLLYIDLVAVALQVVLLGILNVLFYLDKRRQALILCAIFALLNAVLTWISIHLDPSFYGYGFAFAVLIAVCAGLVMLDRKFKLLEYETYMIR